MPKAWLRARQRDYYYRRAKEERLRSRAAYKLLEVANRYGFIKPRDVVVDLGAAPGGWMQAALNVVGESGFVLGVDVKEVEPFEVENAKSIVGDVTDPAIVDAIQGLLPRAADVVVSDVSPNISGVWEVDHARQMDLAHRSLLIANSLLKIGGNFLVKVFQGDLLDGFMFEMRQCFQYVRFIKPSASRKRSSELFVLGMGKL